MQIFKLYFKILRQHARSAILYIVLFMTIFTLFAYFYKTNNTSAEYEATKVKIAVFDEDKSVLSEGLIAYLDEKTEIVEMPQDDEKVKDALFFEQIVYVVTIPEQFEEDFIAGNAKVETQQKPDSVNGYLVDNLLNSYFKNMRVYLDNNSNLTLQEIQNLVQEDFHQTVKVTLSDGTQKLDSNVVFEKNLRQVFFNYLTYMYLALIILIVGMIMTTINEMGVRMRNIAAPINLTHYNAQLLFANLCFCTALWIIFMVIVCILSPGMFSQEGYLYMLNSYIFTLVALGMAYMISVFFMNSKNTSEAISGVANILSLGSSFICGAFVPQAVLGQGVLLIASFTPAYWYVRFNDTLRNITNFSWNGISDLFLYLGVEVLFGIAFVVIALVVSKSKRSVQEL